MSLLFIIIVIAIIVYSYTKQQGQNSENRTNQRMWAEAAHYHGLKLYPASERSVFPAMNGTVDGVSVEIWGDFDDNGHGLIFKAESSTKTFILCIITANLTNFWI